MNNHYNPQLRDYARELRNETVSKAEKYIWRSLLSRNQLGVKFKRQRPIGNFIVDFFCEDIGLIIEIDGNSHLNKGNYDDYREDKLKGFGFQLLRFSEGEVLNQIFEVELRICHAIKCLNDD